MTNYFTNMGEQAPATVRFDAKGKPFCWVQYPCGRCGGAGGADVWKHTGWKCYQCGGDGKGSLKTVKLYTPEQVAKLAASRAKRQAKAEAKAAEKRAAWEAGAAKRDAEDAAVRAAVRARHADLFADVAQYLPENEFANDLLGKLERFGELSEKQMVALTKAVQRAKNPGQHVGTVGERRTWNLTVKFVTSFDTQFGTMNVHVMEDEAGNTVVYKGGRLANMGDTLVMKATVKEHTVRDGRPQTVVSRPKMEG